MSITSGTQGTTGPVIPHVQPGDLIRANDMNLLIDDVTDLLARVAALEGASASGSNQPVITGRDPTGDITAASQLRLIGRNFLVPVNQNTVIIDRFSISQFLTGSDDTQLIFDVPTGFSGLPRDVTVTVTNRNGSDSTTIHLLPEVQVPVGQLVVNDTTGSLGGNIQVGGTYTFTYSLDSQTNIPETYTITPVFTNPQGADVAAWQNGATILGGTQLTIAPGKPVSVGVQVTVPTGATSVNFALSVASQHSSDPHLNPTSGVRTLQVGQAQETSDPRTQLQVDQIGPASQNSRNATINGAAGVEIRFGATGTVLVTATFQVAGTYSYAAAIENAGTVWSVAAPNPPQESESTSNPRQIALHVTCAATGPSPNSTFMVVHAVHLNSDGSKDFSSFIRFPIQGSSFT